MPFSPLYLEGPHLQQLTLEFVHGSLHQVRLETPRVESRPRVIFKSMLGRQNPILFVLMSACDVEVFRTLVHILAWLLRDNKFSCFSSVGSQLRGFLLIHAWDACLPCLALTFAFLWDLSCSNPEYPDRWC